MALDDENPYQPPRDSDDSNSPDGDIPPDLPYQIWPAPKLFHSLELDGPFRECLHCGCKLLEDEQPVYLIERIFRGTEPIVEYALCEKCQIQLNSEMSQESMQAVAELFGSIDVQARIERLSAHFDDRDIDPWLEHCILTGKPRSECRGYQIVGRFFGLQMEVSLFPMMLSDDAAEMVMERLSKKTRDRFDDFMDHFSMPPEFGADITPIIF